jgi:tRNA-dihydrouridine synthase A
MADYAEQQCAKGDKLISITRHMLGLMNGLPGAKTWRRTLSEGARDESVDASLIRIATNQLQDTISTTYNQDAA